MYDGKLYSNYQLKLIDFGSAVDLKTNARPPWPTFQDSPIFSWTNASLEAVKLAKGDLHSHTVNPSDDIFCLANMVAGKSMTLVRERTIRRARLTRIRPFFFFCSSVCLSLFVSFAAAVCDGEFDSRTVNRYYE